MKTQTFTFILLFSAAVFTSCWDDPASPGTENQNPVENGNGDNSGNSGNNQGGNNPDDSKPQYLKSLDGTWTGINSYGQEDYLDITISGSNGYIAKIKGTREARMKKNGLIREGDMIIKNLRKVDNENWECSILDFTERAIESYYKPTTYEYEKKWFDNAMIKINTFQKDYWRQSWHLIGHMNYINCYRMPR